MLNILKLAVEHKSPNSEKQEIQKRNTNCIKNLEFLLNRLAGKFQNVTFS